MEGLIFLGYPLHPAGDQSSIREAYLYRIDFPMLLFAGTRDSLCNLVKLQIVLSKLPAPWKLDIVEGGDHSFRIPRAMVITDSETYAHMVKTTVQWLETIFTRK